MSWMFHFNSDSVVYEGEEAYLPGFIMTNSLPDYLILMLLICLIVYFVKT